MKKAALIGSSVCAALWMHCGAVHADPAIQTLHSFHMSDGSNPHGGIYVDASGNLFGTTETGGNGTVFELSGVDHQTFNTLVTFNKANGANPYGTLTADSNDNLYGTTSSGGSGGLGTVFELSGSDHSIFSTLANFDAASTGGYGPTSDITVDAAGNLYGTTEYGGVNEGGTVFELTGSDHKSLSYLANFSPATGNFPTTGVTLDAAGNVYGTTLQRGGTDGTLSGTAYELTGVDRSKFTLLKAFNAQVKGGSRPSSTLAFDKYGNLYGTTQNGGTADYSIGSLYELTGTDHKTFATVGNFLGPTGSQPLGNLIVDAAGDVFGTAITVAPSATATSLN